MSLIRKFTYSLLASIFIYIIAFLAVYQTGLNEKVLQSEDYLGSAALPFSLINEKNFDLNEYYSMMTLNYPHPDNILLTPYYLRKDEQTKKVYSIRPILTPLLATPIYYFVAKSGKINIDTIEIASRLGGAFITAISCAIFFLILDELLKGRNKLKILLFIIYAFGTNSLSTSSQGLWQHGASQLFACAAIYAYLKGGTAFTGLSAGFAFIARPTNLLFGLFFFLLESLNLSNSHFSLKKKKSLIFIISFFIPVILEALIKQIFIGKIDNENYISQFSGWRLNFIEGFLGLWLSPSKGILINSPIFIFIVPQVFKKLKTAFKDRNLDIYSASAAIVLIHTIVMGAWYSWYGGYSWGYRMASDVIPFMVLLLIPGLANAVKNKTQRLIVIVLTFISILMHAAGLVFFDGIWHTVYDGKSRWWLWSISNSEIVFDLKRLLFKFNLIKTNPYIQ